jgi:hypothetical protein
MLILILLVACTGYIAFSAVRQKTETAILNSIEIQRLVLQMEAGLSNARKIESEFLLIIFQQIACNVWPKSKWS